MSEPPSAARRRAALSLLLFLVTFFTTTATGALHAHGGEAWLPLSDGLSFSAPLLAILLAHELGHYFVARRHGVPASLPFFIPLPPGVGLLGTMGAVIFQGGTTDRRKLIDIGAAGPIAGLLVAIPVLVYGLSRSSVGPVVGLSLLEGNSILYALLKLAVTGRWLPSEGIDVSLHPTALAGWGGLFVTMLNLLPIGQLDGGHIATAYFGDRYERAARSLHRSLAGLTFVVFAWVFTAVERESGGRPLPGGLTSSGIAIMAGSVWIVWFLLLHLMRRASGGRYHPPVDERPLPAGRVALFWILVVTFALVFMPVPLRYSVGAPAPPSAAPASGSAR